MVKEKIGIWGGNINGSSMWILNPILQKQVTVAVKIEDHYEFMECHFEVWHNYHGALNNDVVCVNTLGHVFSLSQLYTEPIMEIHPEKMEICIFDPNDSKDKEILSELSYEYYQENYKYEIL